MYVCLCNGYRDEEIREVAASGVRCAREVYFTLGNGPCCGTCIDCAQGIVNEVHDTPEAARTADERPGAEDAGSEALLMAAE